MKIPVLIVAACLVFGGRPAAAEDLRDRVGNLEFRERLRTMDELERVRRAQEAPTTSTADVLGAISRARDELPQASQTPRR